MHFVSKFLSAPRMSAIATAFILLCASAPLAHAADPGDVNDDEVVDETDVGLIKDHLMERAALTSDSLARADANADGKVDLADMVWTASQTLALQMVSVDTAIFTMGRRDDGDDGLYGSLAELPRRQVTLSAYRIGNREVTNGQYCEVLNWARARGYLKNSSDATYTGGDIYTSGVLLLAVSDSNCQIQYSGGTFTWKSRTGSGGASYSMRRHPVGNVTWYGAVAFCNWMSEKEDLTPCYDFSTWELAVPYLNGYRLPTEAEWEHAAAWDPAVLVNPTYLIYLPKHWIYGFESDTLTGKDRCNYNDGNPNYVNPLGLTSFPYTSPAGWFNGTNVSPNGSVQTVDSPSHVGAYDMSGNVWEFCHDWYDSSYYSEGAMTNPTGPASGSNRVLRGGGWGSFSNCRSAARLDLAPDDPDYDLGFRVARTETPDLLTITLPGGVPMQFVPIPSGSFQMGSPDTEQSHYGDEAPVHSVNTAYNFYMGRCELTQRQWLALMGSWPGTAPSATHGVGDSYPAYYISWNDCQNFITALNAHVSSTGQGPATFRLPSEAEWEYACRAGTQTRFFFGDSLSADDNDTNGLAETLLGYRSNYMWFSFNCQGNANGAYGSKPAGTKLPNQFGLYDMSGNMWEWCQDYWHDDYTGAPSDGGAWLSPTSSSRVLRGGGWASNAGICRSANRNDYLPDERYHNLGVRFVRTQ